MKEEDKVDGMFILDDLNLVQYKVMMYAQRAKEMSTSTEKPLLYYNKQFNAMMKMVLEFM